jgi:AmpD protein
MQIDLMTGLLINTHKSTRYLASPHCDERPLVPIDMIVVHGISLPPAKFGNGYIESFFCGHLNAAEHPYFQTIAELKVSAHLLIARTGIITQFVPFHKRAWHAGQSSFQGRERCNDFSIGIELEGVDDIPYTLAQYQALAEIICLLQQAYPGITEERIVGHATIAPGRKTDPGIAFDWQYLQSLLKPA